MKKICFLIACVIVMSFACSGYAQRRITDNAGLFSESEKTFLEELIRRFQMDVAMDFAVLTTNEAHEGKTQTEIADSFYDENGYGMGKYKSGILYYIDMYERIPYLSTAGTMIHYMTDHRLEAAHDICFESLKNGEYAAAVIQMITAVKAFIYDSLF